MKRPQSSNDLYKRERTPDSGREKVRPLTQVAKDLKDI